MRQPSGSCIINVVVVMARAKTYPQYVVIPVEVLMAAQTLDDVEDWLIANNEDVLARLRESREQHRRGNVRTLEEVEKDLGV